MDNNNAGVGGQLMIRPLRKKTLSGDLYRRDSKVEALLEELSALSHDALIERAGIFKRSDPCYLPSECLLYFLRASGTVCDDAWFERLYRILAERVLRSFPRPESLDGRSTWLTREAVRDSAFGRFVEFLLADRNGYCEKLDFFEVRFDGALASLRLTAQDKVWTEANRSKPLEYDEEDGELTAEVEQAAGSYDPFGRSDLEDSAYRLRLEAAIDTLPADQRRIIHMLMQDFQIDSKEPGVITIAKALGRSEKTIRTYRDKAFATLRREMSNGENR
jgi:hypothetical protein